MLGFFSPFLFCGNWHQYIYIKYTRISVPVHEAMHHVSAYIKIKSPNDLHDIDHTYTLNLSLHSSAFYRPYILLCIHWSKLPWPVIILSKRYVFQYIIWNIYHLGLGGGVEWTYDESNHWQVEHLNTTATSTAVAANAICPQTHFDIPECNAMRVCVCVVCSVSCLGLSP